MILHLLRVFFLKRLPTFEYQNEGAGVCIVCIVSKSEEYESNDVGGGFVPTISRFFVVVVGVQDGGMSRGDGVPQWVRLYWRCSRCPQLWALKWHCSVRWFGAESVQQSRLWTRKTSRKDQNEKQGRISKRCANSHWRRGCKKSSSTTTAPTVSSYSGHVSSSIQRLRLECDGPQGLLRRHIHCRFCGVALFLFSFLFLS